jgi:gamma-glutamyl-gamma-aminobutyrate hydrolase PuuD
LIIGLTQRILYHNGQAYDSVGHGWYSYLKGHTLVSIPNRVDQDFEKLAQELDALIITGGDDSTLRRTVELKLAGQMTLRRRPVVGVCHGAFLLTEVLGGTIEDCIGHHNTEHTIQYFGETQQVNSYHTLAITRLPATATALALDSEGNIEAWIDGQVAAVVWHPERMKTPWLPDEVQNLLFKETK